MEPAGFTMVSFSHRCAPAVALGRREVSFDARVQAVPDVGEVGTRALDLCSDRIGLRGREIEQPGQVRHELAGRRRPRRPTSLASTVPPVEMALEHQVMVGEPDAPEKAEGAAEAEGRDRGQHECGARHRVTPALSEPSGTPASASAVPMP